MRSGRLEAHAQSDEPDRLRKFTMSSNGTALDFGAALQLWQDDPAFTDFFVSVFRETGFNGCRFETPPVTAGIVHRAFEFVILNAPGASRTPDRTTFAGHFDAGAPEGIVSFQNLGSDALLIVPSPLDEAVNYCGLMDFVREAPPSQQRALWREVGRHVQARLSARPLWLSVAGGGVAWLHVRLDGEPKYYRHEPYTMG